MKWAALAPILLCLPSCELPSVGREPAKPPGDPERGAAQRAGLSAVEFYRNHLAAQWGFHCDFEPSCSTYGWRAISAYGFLPGALMAADRLMRDHPYSRGSYGRTADGRPLDPVEDNALFCVAGRRASHPPDERDDEGAASALPDSPRGLFDFAEWLFSLEEWDRARIEYMRYLFDAPQGEYADRCRQRIALCLQELGRYGEALHALEDLSPGPERELLRALVLRSREQLDQAIEAAAIDSDEGRVLAGFLSLEAADVGRAREILGGLSGPLRDALLERCSDFEDLPSRSPALAGVLSAVAPGSGQVYCGRCADGLVAFLINAALIGGATVAALNDEEVTAAAIGAVALGFYSGNVYGGANAAQRFNREARERFLARTRGYVRQNRARLGFTPSRDGGAIAFYFGF